MKRILIALCLLCVINSMHAQNMYLVKICGGFVEYKVKSALQWKNVQQNLMLPGGDSIRIGKGGFVSIEYRNCLYKIMSPCSTTMYQLVEQKRKERSDHFSTVGLIKEINSGKTEPFQMRVVGKGDSRETLRDDYESFAEQLTQIGALAISGAKSPNIKGISFKQLKTQNGEVEFEFDNETNKDYYINILHINKRDSTMSLCYVITSDIKSNACPVTPSGYSSCNMDIYFPDTKDDVYVLIAMDESYDSEALDNELLYHKISDRTKDVNTAIKYMW